MQRQASLFSFGPAVDGIHADTHAAWEALPESSEVDADLSAFRSIVDRLRAWLPAGLDGYDVDAFDTIVRDLDHEIANHAEQQDRAQRAIEAAVDHGSEALAWADDLVERFDAAEWEALWDEVDRARSMMTAPFVPSLDCPACHRASTGVASTAAHDRDCPQRPAPPVTVDPATGLPPRPLSKAAVFDRLDTLTRDDITIARSPAPVISMADRRPVASPCTLCRTGRGKKHGRGCPRSAGRRRSS